MNNTTNSNTGFPGMGRTILTVLCNPRLLFRGIRCIFVIFTKFFLFQYRSALFPGIPVSRAEHDLDESIPFNPNFIRIYLDFTAFWIRIVGFFGIGHGKQGKILAANFISSITRLYPFAFQIYKQNLSTTARPLYKKGFHFRLIHLVDPHLMCIPSLHVMLMIHSYTAFRHCLRGLGKEKTLNSLAENIFWGAITITEAVLYVKQHSINCISAALYVMNRFDPSLFSTEDAETFVYNLFKTEKTRNIPPEYAPFYNGPFVDPKDIAWLREHIMALYRSFMETNSEDWTKPILDFLKMLPPDKQ